MTQGPTQSENINELLTALSKAQSKIECAIKDKKNPFFKSSYADLNSVWEACRDPLTSHGLSVIQTVEGCKDNMILVTLLGHSSGQWIKSYFPMPIQKFDPQSIGSYITYARRYSLSAIAGICSDEDDDGEKAMNRNQNACAVKKATPLQQTEPAKKENLPYVTDEELEIYDKFIYLVPEKDREIARKYIEAAATTKKMRIIEVVTHFNKDMEKFKKNLIEYKSKQQEIDPSIKKAV